MKAKHEGFFSLQINPHILSDLTLRQLLKGNAKQTQGVAL